MTGWRRYVCRTCLRFERRTSSTVVVCVMSSAGLQLAATLRTRSAGLQTRVPATVFRPAWPPPSDVGNPRRAVRDAAGRGCFERGPVAAVDNHHVADASRDRLLAGAQLGNHAGRGRAVADQPRDRGSIEGRYRRAAAVQDTGRRARDHQPPGAKPRRQMPCQRIGVDVEQRDRRGRRRCTPPPARTLADERRQQPRVRSRHGQADVPQIDEPAIDGSMRWRGVREATAPVGAREADGLDTGRGQRRDEPRVHGAGQHRHDDAQRRLVGDPKAVNLSLLDAGRLEGRRRSLCRRRGR